MVKITEVFVDEAGQIREAIKGSTLEACIANYARYVEQNTSNVGEVEKKFISALDKGHTKFLARTLAKRYVDEDKDTLIAKITELYEDGFYAFCDQLSNESVYDVISGYFTDADIYEDLVEYMDGTLDEVVTEMRRTKAEKEQVALQMQIQQLETNIKYQRDSLVKSEERIEELKKKLVC